MKMGISKHEIEFLFRNARFNLDQIENIGLICKVLGKYLFLDRTLLDARADKKIGLSYLSKAVDNYIITEMQHANTNGRKDVFYYQLGMGGRYLLDKAGKRHLDMNILADKEMKSRILTFNYFALEQNYDMNLKYEQDNDHRFFFCSKGVICYFPKVIREIDIIRILIRKFTTEDGSPEIEVIKEKFNFIPIEKNMINVGGKTKTIFIDSRDYLVEI